MTRLKHAIINAMKYRQTLYVPFWGGGEDCMYNQN